MNEKEVAEIRRRFRPEKSAVTHVRGCYVSQEGAVVSQFDQSLTLMPQEEGENLLALLRKALSGSLGRNLLNLSFSTSQVVNSPEHKLLMTLRESKLQDPEALENFFQTVAQSFRLPDMGYLILLAHDTYDVPYRGKDGGSLEDASDTVYSYILCALCPVKETKPVLSYRVPENLFCNRQVDWTISPPEAGFLFPAFDDRCANLYETLFYTKSTQDSHQELADALFRRELPPPADSQRESFQALLTETLGEDCSLDVVQAVQGNLVTMMAQHKEDKDPEPLVLSKGGMEMVLSACGVEEEQREAFSQRFEEEFGPNARLSPQNLVDKRKLEVCTPEVKIQLPPERGDLVETRIIDGVGYILIRAEGGVEVNGVPVHFAQEE
ncbi:MAG: DUF4317 domain-containing protein [Acutalibacter sp.]|jgi:hypothetical protein